MPVGAIAGHELEGCRDPGVGRLPASRAVPLWQKTSSAIVKYGFRLEYADLEPPRTGIFDGRRIVLDPDVDFEMQCFILLHLFGHSVQWVAPSLEPKLHDLQHERDKERFLRVLRDYEFEAARFGLQLLREAGVRGLEQWYSDFVYTDWRYVERYYREDRLPPWKTCVVQRAPRVAPLAIPKLKHRDVEVRFAF